ncbi:MAG: AmmeMemoRadiSam system radical SAM enzyme [bacterium]
MDTKREAMFYEKLDDGKVKCGLCPRRCTIMPDKSGYCGVRKNEDGTLYTLIYGKVSSVNLDPIEKKPLFHFHPGSSCLSLGTLGCNMRCIHCQNWEIAHVVLVEGLHDKKVYNILMEDRTEMIPPERAVEMALEAGAEGIAWTYNEPTIWFEYTYDCAKLAKQNGLYTAYVSNGYITPEALDAIGPYLDAFRVDIKGFTKDLYQRLARVSNFETILEATKRAKEKWNMHVEIVTLVIPGWNDDEGQLRDIAEWIKKDLGDQTPWHVTRFVPYLELNDLHLTPVETLEKARKIGLDAGLKYVYVGNVPGNTGENTYCPKCRHLLIERIGYKTEIKGLNNNKCDFCGETIPAIF